MKTPSRAQRPPPIRAIKNRRLKSSGGLVVAAMGTRLVGVGSPSRSAESSVSGRVPSETPSREEQSHETVGGQAIDHGDEGDSEDDEEPSNEAETADGETPKSRKRVKRVHRWKKSKRIKLRNSGKSYTSAPGKPVSALKRFLFYTFTGLLMCRSLQDTSMTHPVAVVYDVTISCP